MPIKPRSSIEVSAVRPRGEGEDAPRHDRRDPSLPDADRLLHRGDAGSASETARAIDAARARALASGDSQGEEPKKEEKTLFDFTKAAGKGGLWVSGGILAVAGYVGYQASRPVLYTAARVLDWIGQRLNRLADKLIDKKLFVLSWIVNPLVSMLDASAKALGLDKALVEHLKKHAEDRKKVADKVLKDYMATQTKAEKKTDDASAKAKRRKVIEDKFGKEVADAIGDDVDAAAANSKTDSAPAPVPVETLKAA